MGLMPIFGLSVNYKILASFELFHLFGCSILSLKTVEMRLTKFLVKNLLSRCDVQNGSPEPEDDIRCTQPEIKFSSAYIHTLLIIICSCYHLTFYDQTKNVHYEKDRIRRD